MAPKRPMEDILTDDEMALMLVAIRLDAALRRRQLLDGKVNENWYLFCISEEMVRTTPSPLP